MPRKLSEIYAPKPKDEKAFVAKHTIKKTTDKSPATKDDKRFNATNIKTFDRSAKRMGYDPGDDQKAYGVLPGIPSPTDQKTVTAIAPYTVKMGEDTDLEEAKSGWRLNSHTHEIVAPNGEVSARMRLGKHNGVAIDHKGGQIDHTSGTSLHDVVAMAHYRSKGNDFPAHHIAGELHYLSGKDFADHTVKSVKKIKEETDIEEGNLINKKKKDAYIKSIGKEKSARPNATDCKKAGRAELRKEDDEDQIKLTDDDVDMLLDYLGDYVVAGLDEKLTPYAKGLIRPYVGETEPHEKRKVARNLIKMAKGDKSNIVKGTK